MLYLEDFDTRKTRTLEHSRTLGLWNSDNFSRDKTGLGDFKTCYIYSRTHEPSNALPPSSPTFLSNSRTVECSATFRCSPALLSNSMDRAGYRWAEQAIDGQNRLEMDGAGYKWTEEAANGQRRLRNGQRRLRIDRVGGQFADPDFLADSKTRTSDVFVTKLN